MGSKDVLLYHKGIVRGFKTLETDEEAQRELEAYSMNKGKILWEDDFYATTTSGKNAVAMLQAATLEPQALFGVMPELASFTTSTGARTVNVPWQDWGGDSILNIKGLSAVAKGQNSLSHDHLAWQINSRFRGYDLPGREIAEQAAAEIGGFEHIASANPELKFDLNAPIWRPIAVTALGQKLEYPPYQSSEVQTHEINEAVVTMRRFPYTSARIDDFIHFQNPDHQSEKSIVVLQQKWGAHNLEDVFLRSSTRLGTAYKYFRNANTAHSQLFRVTNYPEFGAAAWINFNNIAIDGSVGDLDGTRSIEPNSSDSWEQWDEAIGASLMYLMFVARLKPELLYDEAFLGKYFGNWKKGVGAENFMELATDYEGVSVFDRVVGSIERYVDWSNSPANKSEHLALGFYLSLNTADTWVPCAQAVVNAARQNRQIIGV